MNIKLNPNPLLGGCTIEQESYCGGYFSCWLPLPYIMYMLDYYLIIISKTDFTIKILQSVITWAYEVEGAYIFIEHMKWKEHTYVSRKIIEVNCIDIRQYPQ